MLGENWESIFAKPDQLFVRNKQTNLIFIRKLQLVFTNVKKVIESVRNKFNFIKNVTKFRL